MYNFQGLSQPLAVLAGQDWDSTLLLRDEVSGEPVDLSGVTLAGFVCDGEVQRALELNVPEAGTVSLRIPALSEGSHDYELRATGENGEALRVLYGVVTAYGEMVPQDGEYNTRTLELKLPKDGAARVQAQWRWNALGRRAASDALVAADEAKAAAAAAAGSAAAAADAAADAAAAASGAEEAVQGVVDGAVGVIRGEIEEQLGRLDAASGRVESLEEAVRRMQERLAASLTVDAVTGHLMVANVDTGIKVPGDSGHSPKISSSYTWLYFDDEGKVWRDSGVSVLGKEGMSPFIGNDGYWRQWDMLQQRYVRTSARAQGRDGLDGSATRRVILDTLSQLPADVQRGVFYYVHRWARLVSGVVTTNEGEWDAAVAPAAFVPEAFAWMEFVALNDNASVPCLMLVKATVDGVSRVIGVSDAAQTWASGETVRWDFSRAVRVPAGATQVGFYLTTSAESDGAPGVRLKTATGSGEWSVRYEGLMYGGRALNPSYGAELEGYDVYAPLEFPDGGGQWVLVGEQDDVATHESLGLSRLGTDADLADDDAVVGHDVDKRLRCARASASERGAVLLSFPGVVSSGAAIGSDESGAVVVVSATSDRFGGMRMSTSEVVGCRCVGRMEDGTTGVRWASLNLGGAVRLGSGFNQLNRIPYQNGIGATADHQLTNNLLYGGAVQHKKKNAWVGRMNWLDDQPTSVYFNDTDFYTGLLTTNQFAQSEDAGLTLNSASTTLLAGVYLADSMNDVRSNATPSAGTVVRWVHDECWTKAQSYSAAQVDARIQERICVTHDDIWAAQRQHEEAVAEDQRQHKDYVQGVLDGFRTDLREYERTESLLERDYATNSRVNAVEAGAMKANGIVDKWVPVARTDFEKMQSREKTALYYVFSDDAASNV